MTLTERRSLEEIRYEAVLSAVADCLLDYPASRPPTLVTESSAGAEKAEIERVVRSVLKRSLSDAITKELKSLSKSKDMEKIVVEVTGKALARFFEIMFTRRGTWQNQLKA